MQSGFSKIYYKISDFRMAVFSAEKLKNNTKISSIRSPRRRYGISFAVLGILLLFFLVLGVREGSTPLSVTEIWQALTGAGGDAVTTRIIWDIRLPRVLAAVLLGGALAVSGFLLQTFFHNPIAGPFVLGISSGAKLTVALTLIAALEYGRNLTSIGMMLSAFVGSMISMGFVLLAAQKMRNMSLLVICGVMIGYICSAITDFAVTFADDSNIVNLHNWSMGSFSGIGWTHVRIMAVVVLAAMVCTFLLSKPIGAYQLGETYAANLGVNVKRFRAALILLSSVLSACVTAFAGPISFVGVAVPHLMKLLFGTAKPLVMIPACFLGGSVFCLFCDMLARTLFSPTELSISSVTAVFGAPVVIAVMLRRKRG